MLFDAHTLFSHKQKITATVASTHVVATSPNLGDGEPIYLSVHPVQDFVGLTSLEVQLQHADAEGGPFSTVQSIVLPIAELNGGKLINLGSVPPRTKKYLRLNYVVTGTPTAGAITAGLVPGRQTNGMA